METHPLGMADYQLLGDGFGYHTGYGGTGSATGGQPPGQPTAQPASHQAAQTPILNSGGISAAGSQAYHQLAPHSGPPIRQLGYGPPSDPSKLHDQYSSSYASGTPLSASQSSQLGRGQYNPHDPRYQHSIGGYGSSMGQGHLGLSQHPNAPPSQSSISQLSSASYQTRSLMGQYADQRMHAPGLTPRPSGPVHGIPSHYPASYSASPYGHPAHAGAGDLWSSQGLQHMQQRPPYYPNAPHPSPQTATHSAAVSMHGPRGQNQFVHGQNEYSTMHQQQRPYYQPSGASSQGPQGSSVGGHIPSDGSSIPPYPSSQGPYSSTSSVAQSSSRSSLPGTARQQSQSQFGIGYSTANSTVQPPPSTGSQSAPQQGSSTAVPRYPHQQYSGYGSQQGYTDAAGQSRLSPYGLPPSQGPNSPSYRSPYPGSTSQVSALSPRRPTPTPPAGSPMPPTSHTPDRVATTATASTPQSQGGYPSPGASQLTSPNQGVSPSNSNSNPPQPPPPTNSLQQLEQMVMPHLSASASSSKTNSISSVASSSNSSNSYYGMSVQQSQGSSSSQQSTSQYSHYSPPTSISHQQSSSHSFYQQYQQNSALWQQANQTSTSTSSSSSLPNTHSPLGAVAGVASMQQQSSAPYSSAAQITQQQSGNKQSSLQSPQQPNSISGSNVQATSIITSGSNKSTVSNISSSGPSSVSAQQQYSLFENQFNSTSAVNESGYSKSSSSDNSVSSVMSPRQTPMSQQAQQSQQLTSFDISSLTKGNSSYESSASSQNQKQEENQMQHSLNQEHQDNNREQDYQQQQKPKQSESHSQSSNDPSNFYDVLSPNEANQISSDVIMSRDSQKTEQQRQTPVSSNQTQSQSLPNDQQPFMSQTMPPYGNSYADTYDLGMGSDQMNPSYGASHESMLYEQNYGQGAGMESMMGPGSHMADFGGGHMGDMSSMQPYDPYDDTFASEPSTKRKGKGRPKKDPGEPKKEKKPRQPRAPKGTRGRGRGARNNVEARMPPPPPMPHPDFDGGYSMGAENSDMYPPMIPSQLQQMAGGPPPLPPQPPPHVLQQQPPPPPPPQLQQAAQPQLPPPPHQQPNDMYHPQTMGQPSMPPHSSMSQLPPLPSEQSSFESTQENEVNYEVQQSQLQTDNTNAVTSENLGTVDQMQCDDLFSQSTNSNSLETPLFVIPNEEPSNLLTPQPNQTDTNLTQLPPPVKSPIPTLSQPPALTPPPQPPAIRSPLNNEVHDAGTFEFSEEQNILNTPVKKKGKKRKLKEGEQGDATGDKPKPKVPKKKLPKLALKFGKKKKRKRLGSSDNSDLERTPPPSPDDIDCGVLKRRSARNTKRQKYTDDIELELSEDESKLGVKDKESIGLEGSVLVTSLNDDSMVVDKFLGVRMGTREIEPEGDDPDAKPTTIEVEEYFVKYKNLSYLHCEWKTEEELEKGDKRISQKIKRFKQKQDNKNMFDFLEDEPFNPEYCEVDRILDVQEIEEPLAIENVSEPVPETLPENAAENEVKKEEIVTEESTISEGITTDSKIEPTDDDTIKDEIESNISEVKVEPQNKPDGEKSEETSTITSVESETKEAEIPNIIEKLEAKADESEPVKKPKINRHYLVKWRGLPYEECNWELEEDLDPQKIQHFWKFREPPPKDKWKPKKRPKGGEWKKLEQSPVYKNGNTLREYQLEGVNWLMFCWHNARNCILADEMGLGKTIQSIAFIQEIVKYGIAGPFLVIAPLSTIGNWQREFETWTDLNVITYHGSSASRNMLQEYEMYYKDEKSERIEGIYKFQVMITTFEIVLTDCLELRAISWRCCIIDEAHRLKNRNCKLLEGLRLLDMEHRVLLTGTPLQNNVEELFSLLNFLEPQQFASSEMFMLEFGDLKTEEQVDKLKALLKPMMLRRLKEDVEKSLAPKEETIIEVELTNIQKKYYRAILERNFQFLTKGGTYANMPNLMNTMMELRKCCIHPFLINGAEEQVMHEYKQQHGDSPEAQLQAMIQASGKLVLIDKLLPRLRSDGHRVLIFSQMVRCLDILEDYLVQKRYPYERIDGRVRASLKLGLDKAVLQSMNTQKSIADNAISKKEVEDLLRKGAYGAIMDDDNAGDKFCEEDIEQILQRRTHVITIESEEQGSTFSKASFAASDNRSDIEIDDPNFWEKWAKKAHLDVDELKGRNELIVQEPRKRTQTKRFGQDDSLLDISDVDSSDDDDDVAMRTRGSRGRPLRGKKGRKGRGGGYEREKDEDYLEEFGPGNWTRAECYKVEKGLLTFGWERWDEFLMLGNFRRHLSRQDVEDIARVILLYCLQNYKGDEKIKSFIWDLISPAEQGGQKFHKNHSGLSAPVPRGRKNKKAKRSISEEVISADWARDESYNPDFLLTDEQYRKHLNRHANKILLRVRLLFYLKHEIIGDLYEQVFAGLPARDIPIPSPVADGDPPCSWWDEECDKSLLIGVYKHGYDRFNLMRHDPALCFLHRCGPPDGAALLAEMNPDDDLGRTLDEDEEPETPVTPATPSDSNKSDCTSRDENELTDQSGPLPFPSPADMNQRLRRLITAYQRNFKKQELRLAQQARHQQRLEKLERFEAAIKERELKKREQAQKKWSRREESDFYRVVSSFGVEYNKKEDRFDWSRFRNFSRLERKLDETLTEYFKAFYAMCKRVTGRRLTDEEENLPISVDPISEERASRSLARIDLLSKIREDILTHPELDERLQLCQPSIDLPDWWVCGQHDKDLLIGAAKHGLNRLDFHLMHDPELSFRDVLKNEEIEANKKSDSKQILNKDEEERKDLKESESNKAEIANDEIVNKEESQEKLQEDSIEEKVDRKKSSEEEPKMEIDKRSNEFSEAKTSEKVKKKEEKKLNEEQAVKKEAVDDDKKKVEATEEEMKVEVNERPQEEVAQEGKSDNVVTKDEKSNEAEASKKLEKEEKKSEEKPEETSQSESENIDSLEQKVESKHETVSENDSKVEKMETKEEVHSENKTETNVDDLQNTSGTQTQTRSSVRWPKDRVLQMRLEQICYCVEKNEWQSFRQAFFTGLAGTVPSTPSIATADSSPRAVSPGSLSSVSREPTPHPTPDHTPRRETLSPLPDYLFSESGSSMVRNLYDSLLQHLQPDLLQNDSASRRRRRRRKRFEAEVERAKLRNLLSQTMEQQQQQQTAKKPAIPTSLSTSSLLNPSFLPPLFSLPFCNLRSDLRNELLNDEKTASLLLGSTLSQAQQQKPATSTATTASGSVPPPAHQNSSSRTRNPPLETMDFRFKSTPAIVPPPAPAHKPTPVVTRTEKKSKSPSPPGSVLDLSSGPSAKRETTHGNAAPSEATNKNPPAGLNSKKSGKKIGSRIDALALNLQAKKMMEEKQDKPEGVLPDSKTSDSNRVKDALNFSKINRSNNNNKGNFPTPPAAHSSSTSTSFTKINDNQNFAKAQSAHMPSIDASKLPPSKVNEASSILEQAAAIRQDLKKWLEDHPEFVAANPNLAAAAAAAMSFTPISSIPANTELLELPEGRRRGRRPKLDPTMLDVQHLTGDENVSVVNRLTGKKITGSKAPPLKHLAEWLEKNPMFDVDPKWSPLIKEKVPSFKTPTTMPSQSQSSIRTRTSDRRLNDITSNASSSSNNSTNVTSSNSSSRRTTAASLLAQSQSGAHSSQTTSSSSSASSSNAAGFGFQPSALNPLGFNPSLLTGFPSMKMFMDSANMCTTTSSTTTSSSKSNPLFGFPGFNLPGLAPGSNPLTDFATNSKKDKDSNSASSDKPKSDKASIGSKSKNSNSNSNNPGNIFGPSGSSALGAGGLPFLYPAPNFLYSPLGLGGFSLPSSPFASLAAQTGLMNGLGGLSTTAMSGLTTTTTTTTASHSKSRSAHKSGSTTTTTKNSTANSNTSASSSISASNLAYTAPSSLMSTGLHSKTHAYNESDDESLKSLMGHDDDDDNELNGDIDESEVGARKSDTDAEAKASKKRTTPSKTSKDLSKSKKSNNTAATSKVTS
ncbi:Kismet-like protein [Dinothrombium tinctorium]|uniref:Kismet-like protein n=1 Tax=Dinothrombium tinctorium TaxID=1965070 RepID=A0A3S3NUN2_9ACAR|nr:Kismet-like protein [Dinothrombium tinctorium]